jgi:phage-related tail protein
MLSLPCPAPTPPVGLAQNPLRYDRKAAKEQDMPEPTTSAPDAAPAAVEDQSIRERVKKLTTQALQQGRVDPDAMREVASAVLGRTPGSAAATGAQVRELFAGAVRQLDDALMKSAAATHDALEQLASRGQDFTDNDLKAALISLRKLEEDYVALSNRLAEALNANLRREMTEIAAHAQNLGVEASARAASMMGEFAKSMSAAGSGLATVRGASANMAMLASGVLAGIADALRANAEANEGK